MINKNMPLHGMVTVRQFVPFLTEILRMRRPSHHPVLLHHQGASVDEGQIHYPDLPVHCKIRYKFASR